MLADQPGWRQQCSVHKTGANDPVAHLLTEELYMPSQFAELHGAKKELNEHQRLRLAVIEQAMDDLRYTAHDRLPVGENRKSARCRADSELARARQHRWETVEWFLSDDTDPFSFNGLCDVLDLDADHVRRGLRACGWVPDSLKRESVLDTKLLSPRRVHKLGHSGKKRRHLTLCQILARDTADGSEGKETASQQVPPYPPRSGCPADGKNQGNSDAPSKSLERDAS